MNKADKFLNINTLFDGAQGRSIEKLSDVYNDPHGLSRAIKEVISDKLSEDLVKGKKVLLKPNWVRHSRSLDDEICLRTHDHFILAALRIILEMGPSKVLIGDAPIQGCNWDKMVSEAFLNESKQLSASYRIPVQIKDFRRRTYSFVKNRAKAEIRPLSDYLIFDLGAESLLEPVTGKGPSKFRVTNYDPDRMTLAHSPGVHKYCIAKDLFDADVVLSMPKIKTHQKTGITGALKNLVGFNGDKDFLPHHRIGGVEQGGDCYPGHSVLRYLSELSLDNANRRQGKKSFWVWQKLSSLLWKMSFPGPEHQIAAGWYGNDTTWRMVMDLNRIAEYGDETGRISKVRQRQVYSLCDGIVGGQGDGPLEPDPLPLGVISFTNSAAMNDIAMAMLMGLPIEKLPLLNMNYNKESIMEGLRLNGETVEFEQIRKYETPAIPPKGWKAFLK